MANSRNTKAKPGAEVNSDAGDSSSPLDKRSRKQSLRRVLTFLLAMVILVEAVYIGRWVQVRWSLAQASRLIEEMEYERAIEQLAKASRWSPKNAEVQLQLAKTYRYANKSREFDVHLKEAKRLGANPKKVRHENELMIAQSGFFDTDRGNLFNVIDGGAATDEEATDIYDAMAKGYLAAYRLGDALRCLNYWINWNPDTVLGHFHRADVHYRMGNLRNSMQDYEYVLGQVPNHYETNMRVGRVLQDSNAIDRAVNYFEKARQLKPASIDATLTLAECDLLLNNQERAQDLAKELLEEKLTDYQRAFALELLGRIDLRRGSFVDAVKYLEEAVELAPEDSEITYTMGRVLRSLGETDRAQYYIDYSQKQKELDLRVRDLSSDLIDQPENMDYRYELASILWQRRLYEPASRWLTTILAIDPEHEPSHRLISEWYAMTGKPELSRKHADKAMLLSTRPRDSGGSPSGG